MSHHTLLDFARNLFDKNVIFLYQYISVLSRQVSFEYGQVGNRLIRIKLTHIISTAYRCDGIND